MKRHPLEQKLLDLLLEKGVEIIQLGSFSVGDLIRLLRARLSMTQRQLAKRAGVPQSTIHRIEKGRTHPREDVLAKILAAMGCSAQVVPVPTQPPEDYLYEQAKRVAQRRIDYLEGTMALEGQAPTADSKAFLLEEEIEELLADPSCIWEEDIYIKEGEKEQLPT